MERYGGERIKHQKADRTNLIIFALIFSGLLIMLFIIVQATNEVMLDIWIYEVDLWIRSIVKPLALTVVILGLYAFIVPRVTLVGAPNSDIPYTTRRFLIDKKFDDEEVIIRVSGIKKPIRMNSAFFSSYIRQYIVFPGIGGRYVETENEIILEGDKKRECYESDRKREQIRSLKYLIAQMKLEQIERDEVINPQINQRLLDDKSGRTKSKRDK